MPWISPGLCHRTDWQYLQFLDYVGIPHIPGFVLETSATHLYQILIQLVRFLFIFRNAWHNCFQLDDDLLPSRNSSFSRHAALITASPVPENYPKTAPGFALLASGVLLVKTQLGALKIETLILKLSLSFANK